MWATLIAAGFFALRRADRAAARRQDHGERRAGGDCAARDRHRLDHHGARVRHVEPDRRFDRSTRAASTQHVALAPALACLDGLAGESVEAACEKAVFGSADTAAAAVSYAAGQMSRVIAASYARALTPEQQFLKRAVERDRYGLVAQVVSVRDRCVVTDCPLFRVAVGLRTRSRPNMNDRLYDALVARYSPSWTSAAASRAVARRRPARRRSCATGRPNSVDFANSAAIPPVNIMTPDPPPQTGAARG